MISKDKILKLLKSNVEADVEIGIEYLLSGYTEEDIRAFFEVFGWDCESCTISWIRSITIERGFERTKRFSNGDITITVMSNIYLHKPGNSYEDSPLYNDVIKIDKL